MAKMNKILMYLACFRTDLNTILTTYPENPIQLAYFKKGTVKLVQQLIILVVFY